MRFYIATGLENSVSYQRMRDLLIERGHSLSYDWFQHGSAQNESIDRQEEICEAEIGGVWQADAVIMILPGGRGTHTELGLAIAQSIPVLLFDPDDLLEAGGRICIFYRAPNVSIVRTWEDLEKAIGFAGKVVSW